MFIDSPRFPDDISYGSQGGPSYNTSVIESLSGKKTKNINWQYPLHKYDVSYGIRSMNNLIEVIDFFHVAEGRAHSFRFKDWSDFKSCAYDQEPSATDQVLGSGDGTATQFQLVKIYQVGIHPKTRLISKPVTGTLLVALDGTPTTDYTIDSSGLITFTSAPGNGASITAGYEFDVPCSFDEDYLPTSIDGYQAGTVSVTLSEDRL